MVEDRPQQNQAIKQIESLLGDWKSVTGSTAEELQERMTDAAEVLKLASSPDLLDYRARALFLLGITHLNLNDPSSAIRYFKSIADQETELGSFEKLADTFRNMGVAHMMIREMDPAIHYLNHALDLHKDENDLTEMARDYSNIGVYYNKNSEFLKGNEYQEKSRAIFISLGDEKGCAFAEGNIGNNYFSLGNFEQALKYKFRELSYFEKSDDKPILARCLNGISVVYIHIGDYEKAIDYGLRSLKLKEALGNEAELAQSLLNMGVIHEEIGNGEKAMEFYQRALKNHRSCGDRIGISKTLNNIGNLLLDDGQPEAALEKYKESIRIKEEMGDKVGLMTTLGNIGKIYGMNLGETARGLPYLIKSLDIAVDIKDRFQQASMLIIIADLQIRQGRLTEADNNLQKAMKLIDQNHYQNLKQDLYRVLARVSAKQERFEDAYAYQRKHTGAIEKHLNERSIRMIADMQTRYDIEKKGKEAEIYRLKNVELVRKNKQIEQQRQDLLKTIDRLKKSEIKYDTATNELKKNIGLELIGESDAIRKIINLISAVSPSDNTNVLITGESGTGKEIVARKLHEFSHRANNNFCAVNTSAVPESLLESEFFGYEKDAFTGANKMHIGWFEKAHTGTLFLDEIGTMQPEQQVKLLRVLEERKIIRLGSHTEIPIDVRIISATNVKLQSLVETHRFREDLYHRLSTFIIHIPPLRERKEDIPLLLQHFIRMFGRILNKRIRRIDKDIEPKLMAYDFPGNVRELKNIVERAIIMADSSHLNLKHFSIPEPDASRDPLHSLVPLYEMEKSLVIRALKATGYNQKRAAEILGINRMAVARRIQKYGISLDKSKG